MSDSPSRPFHTAWEDIENVSYQPGSPQTGSASYRLAYDDLEFVMRDELRSIRLQLEIMKPDLILKDHNIHSTIVLFGSARVHDQHSNAKRVSDCEQALAADPENPVLQKNLQTALKHQERGHYYEEARRLAHIITQHSIRSYKAPVVITGGGPGIMEAANRGADDAGGKSIGLNIVLPTEQSPNTYTTPEFSFQFHYFAIRKMHFLLRAKALIAFPGGYGTLDELFETLTLIQTQKIKPVPVILFSRDYWTKVIDFDFLCEEGMISEEDKQLMQFVESADQAWEIIQTHLSD